MPNLGDEQTITPPNTQGSFSRTSSEENLRAGHLNLYKVGMAPLHFTSQPQNRWTGEQQQPNVGQYLAREQANLVYKKTVR